MFKITFTVNTYKFVFDSKHNSSSVFCSIPNYWKKNNT